MKSLRTTVIFAVIAIVLGYLAVQDMDKGEQEDAAKLVEGQLYPDFDFTQVSKVEFKGASDQFQLQNNAGKWSLLEPVSDFAEASRVQALLTLVAEQRVKALPVEAADAKNYALDGEVYSIKLTMMDGMAHKVSISKKTAFDGSYYLQKDGGGEVLLGEGRWREIVGKGHEKVRQKKLYRGAIAPTVLGVNSKKKGDSRFKLKEGQWSSSGKKIELDQSAVIDYVNLVQGLQVLDFVQETTDAATLKKYGLHKPELEIKLDDWWVKFKKKDKALFAVASHRDTVYKMSVSDLEKLQKSLLDFKVKPEPTKTTPEKTAVEGKSE